MSAAAGADPSRAQTSDALNSGAYECEICLEDPTEPVVTFCGHLYCWPCLFRWLRSGHSVCPVCKSGVTQESVIPLYGRGKDRVDPRTRTRADGGGGGGGGGAGGGAGATAAGGSVDSEVPNRPAGQRSEPPPNAAEAWPGGMGGPGGPQIHLAAGFGFFPSLFGLQFQAVHTGRAAPVDQHQAFLDRVMMVLFAVVVFFVLFL